nr:Uncharacterized methyltransferase BT9727_4108 [Streptococcus thermophilus]
MDPSPTPRNFKPSTKEMPGFRDAATRRHTAGAFASGAQLYDATRPSYPTAVPGLIETVGNVLDLGAGTGKLTELLLKPDRTVYAADPSDDMLRVLRARIPVVHTVRAVAEALPLADGSVDAVTCAQTWHWVDTAAASAEAHRVVVPGGELLLCWNTLDVSHPWVLRLSRISHSGDVQREGFYPDVDKRWALKRELRTKWFAAVTTDDLFALARTRSYWLRASEATRAKVTDNLRWYLFDRLGFDEGQPIPLPYRTDAFVYERR